MQKRLRMAKGTEPDPVAFPLADGSIIYAPRTQMKGVYSRYKTHTIVMTEPGRLEFRSTKTAKVFTLSFLLIGIVLIIFTLAAGLPASFIFGGILWLVIGAISAIAWMESIIFSIDQRSGMLSMQKTGPLKQDRPLIIALSDIAAIQVIAVELGSAIDVIVTTYEINLVFAMPTGERIWLLSYGNPNQAKQAAAQLAVLLNRPVLEHSTD